MLSLFQHEAQIAENYRLISRLQNDLKHANDDVVNLSSKMEHKRKLFVNLQDSLQNSVNECLELRHLLEASHQDAASLEKESKEKISCLEDRINLLQTRTATAEKKSVNAERTLKEAQADFRCRSTRSAAGVLYLSCAAVYKRIVARSLHQWRACTAAAVSDEYL